MAGLADAQFTTVEDFDAASSANSSLDPRALREAATTGNSMTGLAARAERIAAHPVVYQTGTKVVPHDSGGRQSAVDYLLVWPNGRRGALEVTLITDIASIACRWRSSKAS